MCIRDRRQAEHDRRQGLGHQHLAHDLDGRGTHGARGLDQPLIDLAHGAFDQPGDERRRRDGQRDDRSDGADRGAGDQAGERLSLIHI